MDTEINLNNTIPYYEWERQALIPGTPANISMMNLLADIRNKEAMLAHVFIDRCIKMLEERDKEKDMLKLQQLAKAKRQDDALQEEELEYNKKKMEAELKASADAGNLPDFKISLEEQIKQFSSEIAKLDNILFNLDARLNKLIMKFSARRKEEIKNVVTQLKQKLEDNTFKLRNANGEVIQLKLSADEISEALINRTNKPLSMNMLKLNPLHTKKIVQELEEEASLVKKGQAIKPEQSVAGVLAAQQSLFGHIDAMGWLAELLGYKEMSPLQLKQLIKNNTDIGQVVKEIKQSYSEEDLNDIKMFYNEGNKYIEQMEIREKQSQRLDHLQMMKKSLEAKVPARLGR